MLHSIPLSLSLCSNAYGCLTRIPAHLGAPIGRTVYISTYRTAGQLLYFSANRRNTVQIAWGKMVHSITPNPSNPQQHSRLERSLVTPILREEIKPEEFEPNRQSDGSLRQNKCRQPCPRLCGWGRGKECVLQWAEKLDLFSPVAIMLWKSGAGKTKQAAPRIPTWEEGKGREPHHPTSTCRGSSAESLVAGDRYGCCYLQQYHWRESFPVTRWAARTHTGNEQKHPRPVEEVQEHK